MAADCRTWLFVKGRRKPGLGACPRFAAGRAAAVSINCNHVSRSRPSTGQTSVSAGRQTVATRSPVLPSPTGTTAMSLAVVRRL